MSSSSSGLVTSSISLLDWLQCIPCTQSPSILLLDGGVSTYLEQVLAQRGAHFEHRELWSSSLLLTNEGCDDIAACHQAFAAAGADILSSVTYQCNYGTAATTETIVNDTTMSGMIRKGLQLARDNTGPYTAASLGCYGAALADGSEYRGDYGDVTRQQLYNFHNRKLQTVLLGQTSLLASSSSSSSAAALSVDAVALETVPNLEEVNILVQVLKDNAVSERGVATWISLACRNGHELNDGTEVEHVLDELRRLDPKGTIVNAVGFNCCHGQYVSSLLRILTGHMAKKGPKRGIVVYPNSGEDWDATTASWKHGTGCTVPEEFAEQIKAGIKEVEQSWKEHSAESETLPRLIVGGCCRTSPGTIASLRKTIDEREERMKATQS
jgi:homocysteine S-methyltransferase